MTDYTLGLKHNVLSPKMIAVAKSDPNLDFAQEFKCKFTSPKSAAFDSLVEENFLPEGRRSIDLSSLLKHN